MGRELTRAEFLKLSASLAGGATLAGAPAARALASGLWSGSDSLAFADTVLRGGKVAVMDEANTFAQAVAVVGGLILATGSDLDVQASIGPQTRVVELHGRTVTPGLVDPHLHFQVVPQFGGFYIAFIPPEVTSIAELQDAVGEELATLPAGTWLGGYYLALSEGRPPTRQDLDPASPDHPVFVFHQAGHYGTANTRALELAGITGSTADPVGGIIERDGAGQPTGVLYNHRAMDLVRKVMPRYTDQMVRDGILATQPMFAACGVTTYHDNNIRGASAVAAYQQLAREGRLTLRNALYFTLEYPSDVDIALNVVEHYQDAYTRFAGFKFLIDGQATTFYCHEPHTGVSWQTTTWEVGSFKQAVRALHDTGLQVCVHCGGDAAVDLALDAFEEAMNANPRSDPRHRLEHAVLTRAASTQRIKDLGVVVSTQASFIRMSGDYYKTLFGEERMPRIIVVKEWLDAGIPVALGSDAPTTPWTRPQVTLAAARVRLTASNQTLGADQILTIDEALRAHTITAAYAGKEEHLKGSLEPGKLADLIVWTQDPYALFPRDLQNATLDLTMVGGAVVYGPPRQLRRRLDHP